MKQNKTKQWVCDDILPAQVVIIKKEYAVNQWEKQETLLCLRIAGQEYWMSIWGKNLNTLIDKFGDDDDKWIGKSIMLSLIDEKKEFQ